jgi:hypothetical protein
MFTLQMVTSLPPLPLLSSLPSLLPLPGMVSSGVE